MYDHLAGFAEESSVLFVGKIVGFFFPVMSVFLILSLADIYFISLIQNVICC